MFVCLCVPSRVFWCVAAWQTEPCWCRDSWNRAATCFSCAPVSDAAAVVALCRQRRGLSPARISLFRAPSMSKQARTLDLSVPCEPNRRRVGPKGLSICIQAKCAAVAVRTFFFSSLSLSLSGAGSEDPVLSNSAWSSSFFLCSLLSPLLLLSPHTRIAVRVSGPYRERAKSSASSQQTATTAPPGLGIAHVVYAAPPVNTTPYFCVCV